MEQCQRSEQQRRGLVIEVGTVLDLPADIVLEDLTSFPSHDGPTLIRCTRLKQVGWNPDRFETRHEGKGLVLMLPPDYVPEQMNKVKVTWIASNGKSMAAEELAD